MQVSEALRIIRALADGCDPITGEAFPDESPYQHPQVVRALMAAAGALEEQGRRERRGDSHSPGRAGEPWSQEEDKELLQGFDSKKTLEELAQQHQRTLGAIRSRLEKWGKIPPGSPPA